MCMGIDLGPTTLMTEIASAVNQISSGFDTSVTRLSSSLNSLTQQHSSSCDIFGTIMGLISVDAANMYARFKSMIGSIQESIGDTMKSIARLLSNIKEKKDAFISAINSAVLTGESKFVQVKNLVTGIITKICAIFDVVDNIVASIVEAFTKLMAAMLVTIKAKLAVNCVVANAAIKAVGTGSGIDQQVNLVNGVEGAVEGIASGINSEMISMQDVVMASVKNTIADTQAQIDSIVSDIDQLKAIV